MSAIRIVALLLLAAGPAAAAEGGTQDAVGAMSQEEVTALVREISPQVEELRGLAFDHAVPVSIVNDAVTRKHVLARLDKLLPKDKLRNTQEAYAQLGLVPAGTDILGDILGVLEEQVGGFYDPDTDTFYVLDDMPRSIAPLLIAHELTHALDDQHFDIDRKLEEVSGRNDASEALSAVVEGSGTLVMSAFLIREIAAGRMGMEIMEALQNSDAGRAEKLKALPLVMKRQLIAPYILGQTFLLKGDLSRLLLGVKGADLDQAFSKPPVSFEQILHPEKYWSKEAADLPRDVSLPDLSAAAGEGFSLQDSDTLGELEIAVMTGAADVALDSPASALPSSWTNEASSGWDGDLWQTYVRGDSRVTVLASLWDSPGDAAEFEAALAAGDGRLVLRRADAVVVVAGGGEHAGPLAQAALEAIAPAPAP